MATHIGRCDDVTARVVNLHADGSTRENGGTFTVVDDGDITTGVTSTTVVARAMHARDAQFLATDANGWVFAHWACTLYMKNGAGTTTRTISDRTLTFRSVTTERDYDFIVCEAMFRKPYTVLLRKADSEGSWTEQYASESSRSFGTYDDGTLTLPARESVVEFPFHSFLGWNTEMDGSGITIADRGNVGGLGDYASGGVVALYAQWEFVGFSVSVANMSGVGSLSLVRVSDGVIVATESNGVVEYTGEANVSYKVVCKMADGYVAPAGIAGLTNDTFTPSAGQSYEYEYEYTLSDFFSISLPAEDANHNSLAITSPVEPDTTIGGVPVYTKGRDIEISAVCADEWSLTKVYLDDTGGHNIASYTGDAIAGGRFSILDLQQSYAIRATFGERLYSVTAAADAASASALTVSVEAGKSSVVKDTSVTFTATEASGYSFVGWYLDGDLVSSALEYTRTITADTHLVAKAKVSVKLSLNDSVLGTLAITANGESKTPGAAFDLVLGESFSYSLEVTADQKYLNGWFDASDTLFEHPLSGFGAAKTVTPTAAMDIVARIGTFDPDIPITVNFAYASTQYSGPDTGRFSVDGEEGPQTVTRAYVDQAPPSVTLAVEVKNGYEFVGWFSNEFAQGDPLFVTAEGLLTLNPSMGTIYAKFDRNRHSICEWEGAVAPKSMVWRSKTYAGSKPFNPSACRVDALGYPPGIVPDTDVDRALALTVDMFSSPDANAPGATSATLNNISNQNARRLPVMRPERYMQVEVKANAEVDALFVGTSMGGLAQ